MPRKQRGGVDTEAQKELNNQGDTENKGVFSAVASFFTGKPNTSEGSPDQSEQQSGQTEQQSISDQQFQPEQVPSTIKGATKKTIHTSVLSIALYALAVVRIAKGTAKGVAEQGEQAGFKVSSATVEQASNVGKEAIQTTGELAVASLKGAGDGGKVFLEETIKHALLAAKEIGGAGLMTTESIGRAIESPEVQEQIKGVVKHAAATGLYAAEDVILLGELITKATAKALTIAVQSIAMGGGGRRRTRHRRSANRTIRSTRRSTRRFAHRRHLKRRTVRRR